ncbi:hypothetical protein CASFOL_001585 [Castilleja foliolosa]|uniref:F-box domain-containing protein n=1 Tax=Castilleja foliolosa TaxID=1961234 RepID=A0ABD3EJL0_9LAMI
MTRPAVHTKTMSSSNKRLKETQIDRLSDLPDSLIIRILSLLEVKQYAITAVLAKRYRYLWRESPRLVFIEESQSPGIIRDFVARVNRTLLVISGVNRNGVKAFEIRFLYTNIYRCDVDVWFDFAIRNNVKQLSVLNNRVCGAAGACDRKYIIGLPYFVLIVYHKLLGVRSFGGRIEKCLQTFSPYIHILGVKLDSDGRKVSLGNISSLVRATFECVGSDLNIDTEEEMDNVKELLEKIRHVKMVGIAGDYNRVLSSLAMIGYRFPQTARTWMSVRALTKMRSVHGIIGQLESCPILEELVIEGLHIEEEPVICPDPKGDLICDLLYLKTITFENFVDPKLGGEPMLTLARVLLNKSPALEKMNIEGISLSEPFKIAQTLLSYPRSSVKAVIIFN